MVNEIFTNIALGVVALFFVGLACAVLWPLTMGKLELRLPDREIVAGEAFDVSLILRARRSLAWKRVVVSLVCRDTGHSDDDRPSREVYRQDVEVDGPGRLGLGALREFRATLATPEAVPWDGVEIGVPEALERVLKPLTDLTASRRARDFEWRVEAYAETLVALSVSHRLEFGLVPSRG